MTEPSPTQYVPPEDQLRPVPQAPSTPGQPVGSGGPQTSGMAIAALVLGICGLVICPFFLSVPAIVFGAIAMHDINRDDQLDGRGMAIAGFVTGIVGTSLSVILVIVAIAIGIAEENDNDNRSTSTRPRDASTTSTSQSTRSGGDPGANDTPIAPSGQSVHQSRSISMSSSKRWLKIRNQPSQAPPR